MIKSIGELLKSFFMAITIGGIDIGAQTLQNEYISMYILELVSLILSKNPQLNQPSAEELDLIKNTIIKSLQQKYPTSGVELKT